MIIWNDHSISIYKWPCVWSQIMLVREFQSFCISRKYYSSVPVCVIPFTACINHHQLHVQMQCNFPPKLARLIIGNISVVEYCTFLYSFASCLMEYFHIAWPLVLSCTFEHLEHPLRCINTIVIHVQVRLKNSKANDCFKTIRATDS